MRIDFFFSSVHGLTSAGLFGEYGWCSNFVGLQYDELKSSTDVKATIDGADYALRTRCTECIVAFDSRKCKLLMSAFFRFKSLINSSMYSWDVAEPMDQTIICY